MFENLPPVEHMPNGFLPRMTPKQRREANVLIDKLCCNYNNGNCILLDGGEPSVCPQSISYSVNCKFFRHVLLEDKLGQTLKAEIFRDDTLKYCSVCGQAFQSFSNNAKYCERCAKTVLRKQKAEYARKQRSKLEK